MIQRGLSVMGLAVLVLACVGCGDEGERGPYDVCEVGQCSDEVDGCAGVAVEYADRVTEMRAFCTSECASSADCPLDAEGLRGECMDFGELPLCFQRCDADDECPPDFGCVDRLPASGGGESFFEPICLPIR